ncbi:MAG: undecaprenyl-diphosphate phosphatase [Candidatus Bathyarchaeia archaeon]
MSTILHLIYAAIIGLIQGISEWLPISSKTQIIVSSTYLLKLTFQQAYTFGLFMEIGTIIAAVVYFRKDLIEIIQVLLGSKNKLQRKLLIYIVIVTLITAIIAVPIYLVADSIKGIALGIPMLIVGLILIADAVLIRYSRKRREKGMNSRKLEDLTLRDCALVGIVQGIAALPGVSRSGVTTSAMLLMNVEPDEAFRLSFLAGIFASIGAFGLTLIVSKSNVAVAVNGIGLAGIFVAIIVSTIVSLFLIDFLIKVAGKSKIIYLITALGIIAMASGLLYLTFGL